MGQIYTWSFQPKEPISIHNCLSFPLVIKAQHRKKRSTGMSNGTFVLDWVENGEKATRSPGCKTSSCGSDPWRTKLEPLPPDFTQNHLLE